MATDLNDVQHYDAPAGEVFDKFADRAFVDGRLQAAGGIDPEITELTVDGEGADRTITIVTTQAIPASALPSMVSSMLPGDPLIIRTEKWRADGDGYVADFDVVIKNAPATLKGTMTLAAAGEKASTLTIDGQASVPIPLFGGKVEGVIVEQVGKLLAAEENYTRTALAG